MRHFTREQATKLENTIIRAAIRPALKEGFSITVETYGEDEITRSTKITDIMAALRATDYDRVRFYDDNGKHQGWMFLVWGNDPWEVVSDHSIECGAERFFDMATAKATEIEERYYN